VIWDNHLCMSLQDTAQLVPYLERCRAAGLSVISVNAGFSTQRWAEPLQALSAMRRAIALHPDRYVLISKPDDIDDCQRTGRLGIVFDIEGMDPVLDAPSMIQTFYELGVRWMLIAYNRNNRAGGGCLDQDGGLTSLGRSIIDEMQRVGMVLCLSHAGERTVRDALDYASGPVIFSHSNPAGATPHPRNVCDSLLRRCADTGGVIGLSGVGPFLGAREELVEKLLQHLRYTVDLVGPSHVGLSLDYVFDRAEMDEFLRTNPDAFPPALGFYDGFPIIAPESFAEIAEGLARIGLADGAIDDVMGGNWRRIAQQVWR
jgi:membrane dipeptidase